MAGTPKKPCFLEGDPERMFPLRGNKGKKRYY
jgi:hypothetical protein